MLRLERHPLLMALIFSTIAHLILLFCFRIKMFDFPEQPVSLAPINVAIDQESSFLSTIVTTDTPSVEPLVTLSPRAIEPFFTEPYVPNVSRLQYRQELYPIQLKLSANLKSLTIIDDGSSHLKKRTKPEETYQLFLSTNRSTVEYEVTICGKTGKIVRCNRSKELLDKELQQEADCLVEHIAFAPFDQDQRSGSLWLTLFSTGDELYD